MSFNEWKPFNLGDLVEISSSKRIYAKEYTDCGVPFYRSKEIIEKSAGNDISTKIYISRERFLALKNKFGAPEQGDILLTSVGTLGVPYVVREEEFYFKDGNLTWMKNFNKACHNQFIYYWILSDYGKSQIDSKCIGSTQKALTIETLNKFELLLPPLPEQKAIARVLSTLDEKIEVNSQINKTLENMAEAIFKHWFVDFEFPNENGSPYKSSGGKMAESELGEIPEGWEICDLADIAEIIMGQSPKSDTYNNDNIGLPLINGASDFKKGYINPLKFTSDPKKKSQPGDYVFGVRATVGNVTYVDKEYALGRGVGIARSKMKSLNEFLYFVLVKGINYLESTATGSVYINLSKDDFRFMKIISPPNSLINDFHRTTISIFEEINLKYKENLNLQEIRDVLLPKLLSGEIELRGFLDERQ